MGKVKTDDGVYGLGRTLIRAGSQSPVMSLWKVSYRAPQELMVAYSQGLLRGEGRTQALRRVELRMLRSPDRRHPCF